MKVKLVLDTIEITSFVTEVEGVSQAKIQGGISQNNCSCTACAPEYCAVSYECGVPTLDHTCVMNQNG